MFLIADVVAISATANHAGHVTRERLAGAYIARPRVLLVFVHGLSAKGILLALGPTALWRKVILCTPM